MKKNSEEKIDFFDNFGNGQRNPPTKPNAAALHRFYKKPPVGGNFSNSFEGL